MFVPKIRLFPLFYWFVNFTLTDKHGTKNLLGLIRPWFCQLRNHSCVYKLEQLTAD